MLRINNIKIREDISNEKVFEFAIQKHKINKNDILDWHISRKSIDARNKNDVHYLYAIDIDVKNENKYKKLEKVQKPDFSKLHSNIGTNMSDDILDYNTDNVNIPNMLKANSYTTSPVVVGAGPSGLFAALYLIRHGIKPIVIEQGEDVDSRKKTVDNFLKTGDLNCFSNVQFGEGGSGTFSDGKLTTGINNPLCNYVLQEFVNFGAPESILYLAKPHIGTDKLIGIIRNIREFIISQGGTFLFNSKVIDFKIENNKIRAIYYVSTTNSISNEIIELKTDTLILAIGHSARDTFEKLYEKGFSMEKKNFSVGVRIEHLQEMINSSQYGTITKLKLPPAEYKLAYHSPSGRSCYTFCMCPGGTVMASSSEKNTIVTNGMSNYLRDGINANSAVLVNVVPEDFESESPLAGIYFQKDLEEKAFVLGGSNYFAPIQRTEDFLNNKKSELIGSVKPTYKPGVTLSNLQEILPQFVTDTLKEGLLHFDTKLHGFANPDSLLTGLETRSSSPVRILRNENLLSNIDGVYPCGEGAGYAGGIMSAAVDGIKCAQAIFKNSFYKNL